MKVALRWISLSVAVSFVTNSVQQVQAAPVAPVDVNDDLLLSAELSRATDPCLAATSSRSAISYSVAKACLDANFPFPDDHRSKTAESVKGVIQGGFVFEDLAADPPTDGITTGLTLEPAPIITMVDNLAAETTSTWREFHDGISLTFIQARDAHLSYNANCFRQFRFGNGLILGDMRDPNTGERAIKVVGFIDQYARISGLKFNPSMCDVVTIDDTPAVDFVQAWADKYNSISKDANVRYTSALSTPAFNPNSRGSITYGGFSLRNMLPEEESLEFGFVCPHLWGDDTVNQFTVKWGALYENSMTRLTTDGYYRAYCVDTTAEQDASATAGKTSDRTAATENDEEKQVIDNQDLVKQVQNTSWEDLPEDTRQRAIDQVVKELKEMPKWLAQRTLEVILGPEEASQSKLEETDTTEVPRDLAERVLREMPAFDPMPQPQVFEKPRVVKMVDEESFPSGYRLLLNSPNGLYAIMLADEKTGVITIPTFSIPSGSFLSYSSYYANFLQAIDVLRPKAERLILDVSRNYGGAICLSRRFIEAFFPELPPDITNIRYSPVEQQLIDIRYGFYDYFHSWPQDGPATAGYLGQTVSHENRQYAFSNYVVDDCSFFNFRKLWVDPKAEAKRPRSVNKGYVYDPNKPYHPWDPEDMLIFSDGTCGSACAMFSNQLVQKAKVSSLVVGGGQNDDLVSYSTFPGLQVVSAEEQYFEKKRFLKSRFGGASVEPEEASSSPPLAPKSPPSSPQERLKQQPLVRRANALNETGSCSVKSPGGVTEISVDTPMDANSIFVTRAQRDELLRVLPEPFQHQASLTITYRQVYNTHGVTELFVRNDEGEWVLNWGPDIAQWNEYSFLPADYRLSFAVEHFMDAYTLWEDARDAVWSA